MANQNDQDDTMHTNNEGNDGDNDGDNDEGNTPSLGIPGEGLTTYECGRGDHVHCWRDPRRMPFGHLTCQCLCHQGYDLYRHSTNGYMGLGRR